MKKLIILTLVMFSSITFSQNNIEIDNVVISINKDLIIVNIPKYSGKIVVIYRKIKGIYISKSEYVNMSGFQENKHLSTGYYILEVKYDKKVKKTAKFRIN